MKTEHKTSLLSVLTILAVLASTTFGKIVTTRADCERLLRADLAKVAEKTNQKLEGPDDIYCSKASDESLKDDVIEADIGEETYRFIAVDQEDAGIIELYKEGGMGSDLIHVGTAEGFDMYLWPLKDYKIGAWNNISFYHDHNINRGIVERLRDMAAKKIYPQEILPKKVYYTKDGKIAFISHKDLQRENPQTVHGWIDQLLNTMSENRRLPVFEVKNRETVKKLQDALFAFIRTPSTDQKFFDELLRRMDETEKQISTIAQEEDTKSKNDTANAMKFLNDYYNKKNSPDKSQEKVNTTNEATSYESSPLKSSQALEKTDPIRPTQENIKAPSVDKETVVQRKANDIKKVLTDKKSESKTVDQHKADDDFSYTPYIVGGLIVLGCATLVVAVLVMRRKSTPGTARNGLIA